MSTRFAGLLRAGACAFRAASKAAGFYPSSGTGPTTGILLEDAVSFLLAENGDYLVQE